jgi:ATP-dependent DNA helicase PIF1
MVKLNSGRKEMESPIEILEGATSNLRKNQALVVPENMILTDEMKEAINLVKSGKNVFITGRAGTGKSTLLAAMAHEFLNQNVAFVAPTGVAAVNIGGSTIHRFFGFPVNVTKALVTERDWQPKNAGALKRLKTLVIDEISMVRADMMDHIETALRRFGPNPEKPFGGVQVVFFGDMRQLPPVVIRSEYKFFRENFDSWYFYSALGLVDVDFEVIELKRNFRQESKEFYEILSAIRDGNSDKKILKSLNTRVIKEIAPDKSAASIRLVTTNKLAFDLNIEELNRLETQEFVNHSVIKGVISNDEKPTDDELHFKVGARIMMVQNDQAQRWVNGSRALIIRIDADTDGTAKAVWIRVDGESEDYELQPFAWEVLRPVSRNSRLEYDLQGTFTQYPFKLCWAITIHKSQGKTFDDVIIDLRSDVFVSGQLYVALSRCRTLEGITLVKKLEASSVTTDDRITMFLESLGIS